MFGRLDT
ncbi:hypothetical protein Zm00014a_043293 [Zea mays]|nr:hypothetical protein Zm00014a_043293 [Zea mays]